MTYYLAIDNRAYYRPAMRILHLVPDFFHDKEFRIREARNYAITLMKKHPEIFCITILKRIKKDTYHGIERVYPDGITADDDVKTGWDFIHDYTPTIHECYKDTFTSTYKVIETV